MVEGAPGVPDQLSYTAEVSINYNFLCILLDEYAALLCKEDILDKHV